MTEELWQNITDNIHEALLVQDKDGNFLYANSVALDLFGYSLAEGLSFNSYQLYESGVIDVHVFAQLIKTKRTATSVQVVVRKDLTRTPPLFVTQTPIFDEAGNVKYAIEVIRDMDTLNRMYSTALHASESATADPRRQVMKRAEKARTLIIASDITRELLRRADSVADSAAPVLVQGESGTGKELIAEYIHRHSPRAGREMVAINCAALPEGLLESELFGYEKGAFSGSSSAGKPGLIELAHGGTLFLDEIDSLPLSLQAKLLRVLETGQVRRLGAIRSNHIDFRLISASNANLEEAMQEKRFRIDLYHRLSIVPLFIPPLRERVEEIRPLCKHFLEVYSQKYSRQKQLSEKVMQRLEAYPWPGNIRELRNLVERIMLMTDSTVAMVDDIPGDFFLTGSDHVPVSASERDRPKWAASALSPPPYNWAMGLKDNVRAYERWAIEQATQQYASLTKAAKALDADKSTLIRKRKRAPPRDD